MLPELFLKRMQEMLGEEYEAFLKSYDSDKFQALRLNGLKKREDGKSAAQIREAIPFSLSSVPWAQNGYYYDKVQQPGKHPYHEAGLYYIQEPSAMAPVSLLEAIPGEKILDLCAAPGGKSTQIAAALEGEGLLVCNEIHPARAKILSENIERMGIKNACVTNETPKHLAEFFEGYFDRILVDAPCSGEGMFRKNEEACEQWSVENVELCAERQDEILDCAARMLRPGGRLVYSTCTFAPRENEGSISRFLERHEDFSLVPIHKQELFFENTCEAVDEKGEYAGELDGRASLAGDVSAQIAAQMSHTLRLWPHKVKGEGHFAAVLKKAGEVPEHYSGVSLTGVEKGIPQRELKEWNDFAGEFLTKDFGENFTGKYLKFGDNIYLAPEEMPGLKGLKVLRPGLQIGTLKKNRFEPSHALALAISPKEAVNVWNLSSEDTTVNAYLGGQTFAATGQKGWYLICVDGFSIGWGKLAGGIMKNHYPKGLRKM